MLAYTLYNKELYKKEKTMKREYLPEESNFKHDETEKQKTAADDLKFVRSVVEKTYRQVRPDTHLLIMWGLVCVIAYTTTHFLAAAHLHKWVPFVGWPLVAIGLCYTFITWLQITKREKRAGFIPRLPKQVGWVWIITSSHFLAWSILGTLFNNFYVGGDPMFLGAMHLSIALSVTGILHSKEWLFGGIGIFAAMVLTYFVRDYDFIILGLATGAGLIIPAIIAHRNYYRQEKENEQA